MFPYPSGTAMHAWHASNFLVNEIVARYHRMLGDNVIFPIGYDSFWLPTENYAIKNNKSAHQATEENIKYFEEQLAGIDFSFDMSRRFKTSDPEYYRWTQWIFTKLFEHGLVYRKDGMVNWCNGCQTVLANDQVVDGKCERCETEIIQKKHPQWYIKITDYADQLLDYSDCDRPEETKIHQKNWIGKSIGCEASFMISDDRGMISDDDKSQPNSDLTYQIIGCAYKVHKELGSWLSEKIYHNAMKIALQNEWLKVSSEEKIDYSFDGQKVWVGFIDLVVEWSIVLELKSRKEFQAENYKQLRTYMNQWDYETWLLLNFYNNKVETKRLDSDHLRKSSDIIWENHPTSIVVFTTRIDTIYWVTAVVLAPENEIIDQYMSDEKKSELANYRRTTALKTNIERQATDKDKTWFDSGVQVIHPLTGDLVPVWFADYVLPDYATGAVMFVPAHDERDDEFSGKYGIWVKVVIVPEQWQDTNEFCYTWTGFLINSDQFNWLDNITAKAEITSHLESIGKGIAKVTYRLRDWSVSRQRYRGSPIPVYYTFEDNQKVPYFEWTGDKTPKLELPVMARDNVSAIVKHRSEDKYLFIKWNNSYGYTFVNGWIDGKDPVDAARDEVQEETGYQNLKYVETLDSEVHSFFYAHHKWVNRYMTQKTVVFELENDACIAPKLEEHDDFEVVWLSKEEAQELVVLNNTAHIRQHYQWNLIEPEQTIDRYNPHNPHPDKTKWIPHLIPESELPVILPLDLPNYKPAGKSPLEDHPSFKYYTPSNKQVPLLEYKEWNKKFKEWELIQSRNVIQCFVKDKDSDQYCFLKWSHDGDVSSFFWGVDNGEDSIIAAQRELLEEGWFADATFVKHIVDYQLKFYHPTKLHNQWSICTTLLFEVDKNSQQQVSTQESAQHTTVWMTSDEFLAQTHNDTSVFALNILEDRPQTIDCTLINQFNEYNPQPTYLRECDTLDTFMCSSFYFLRFCDPHNTEQLISPEAAKLMPVDLYVWGKEHTVGHLLYSRFIYKFLKDIGAVACESKEPFRKLVHQGMVHAHDGRKMSKRWGNVVDPMTIINEYGSDTLRVYTMFMWPVEASKNWNPDAVAWVHRFMTKVERLAESVSPSPVGRGSGWGLEWQAELISITHQTIQWVTEDIELLKFNTAVSKLMILSNAFQDAVKSGHKIDKELFIIFLQLLAPFATQISDQLWKQLWQQGSIHDSSWPVFDPSKVSLWSIDLPIQVNGKVRGTVTVSPWATQEHIMELAAQHDNIAKWLEGQIVKIIHIQDKICNVIVK